MKSLRLIVDEGADGRVRVALPSEGANAPSPVTLSLTPEEARRLATELRTVANRVERKATRKPVDLDRASHYLSFEVYFFRLFARLYGGREDAFRRKFGAMIGAAIEYAAYVHLRVLIDFFHTEPRVNKDDVWVGDFRDGSPEFAEGFPSELELPPEVRSVRETLHKRFAHFTESRWLDEQPKLSTT